MIWITLILGTVCMIFWLMLLLQVKQDDWVKAAYAQVVNNTYEINRLQQKLTEQAEKLSQYHGIMYKVMSLLLKDDSDKKIRKLQDQSEELQEGYLKSLSVLPMPGFVLLRRVETIGHGNIHKTILLRYVELYGRKYAHYQADKLLAEMCSYALGGTAAVFLLGTITMLTQEGLIGVIALVIGMILVGVLIYAMYDDVNDRVNKRRKVIARQFPNVVSKLALLVTSGMIVDRAWRETAESQSGYLYHEMQQTANELANLVEPATAYTNFINRCNTKETTKLASAIIQSQSKGNAEIGKLLQSMAHEAWQERRHMAKRDSEAANSKLMIPTMLLFVSILVMIMGPVALSFSGL